jgi:predicted RNase H-like HicB family nuclease
MQLLIRFKHSLIRLCSYASYRVTLFCGSLMVARKFTVLLEPAEEGGFIVKCLELPVATQGETKEEALKNIKEAIEGSLEGKAKLDGKINGGNVEVIIDKVIVKAHPKASIQEKISRSIQEMKEGNYVSLDELQDA